MLHLFYGIRGDRNDPVDVAEAAALVESFEREPDYQVIPFSVIGQRADVGWMAIGPDFVELQRLQRSLEATALGARLEPRPELSFVSITEASEYLGDDGSDRIRAMRDTRMHPRDLPMRRMICFYPMSKRRGVGENWNRPRYEERRSADAWPRRRRPPFSGRPAADHGSPRAWADWEWGVTLLADDPKAIKDVVYEMRYDEGSAIYGEFGPFTLGLVAPLGQAVRDAGLAVAG